MGMRDGDRTFGCCLVVPRGGQMTLITGMITKPGLAEAAKAAQLGAPFYVLTEPVV
jgi:hypothetical protein